MNVYKYKNIDVDNNEYNIEELKVLYRKTHSRFESPVLFDKWVKENYVNINKSDFEFIIGMLLERILLTEDNDKRVMLAEELKKRINDNVKEVF